MDKETRDKILKWIFDNHEHHAMGGHNDDVQICEDGEYPYVNSLELEKFIKEL